MRRRAVRVGNMNGLLPVRRVLDPAGARLSLMQGLKEEE